MLLSFGHMYVPDPPLLQPVGWEMSFILVYVNDTILLGGFSDKHISPQSASISYTGSSSQFQSAFFEIIMFQDVLLLQIQDTLNMIITMTIIGR